MKILITGGDGFLARNLNTGLNSIGYSVDCLNRNNLDLLDRWKLTSFIESNEYQFIIHCAVRGGHRGKADTFENTYLPNLEMFENILHVTQSKIPMIIIGSGAEFDRRNDIRHAKEEDIFTKWPIDPYGLSKNIIARRSLQETDNIWIVRLFGCFHYNESVGRFFRNTLDSIRNNTPVEIHQNIVMDFFSLIDFFKLIDYTIQNQPMERNINAVYEEKLDLVSLAKRMYKYLDVKTTNIRVHASGKSEYTGDSNILYSLPVANSFLGYDKSIEYVCSEWDKQKNTLS